MGPALKYNVCVYIYHLHVNDVGDAMALAHRGEGAARRDLAHRRAGAARRDGAKKAGGEAWGRAG